MNCAKILSNCACSKRDLATLLWLLACIFKAGLEQEIESLKKRLAACTRDNVNLQEELSEAYRIKGQLAELHGAELFKNTEAEKQVKFFQGCVAAAFAERDHSLMEAEKAKEAAEFLSQKFNDFQKRVDELTIDCIEQRKLNDTLRLDLAKQEEQNEAFKKVVDKLYEIRQNSLEEYEDVSWDDKYACLLHDPAEMWSFSDDTETSTSKYISTLEEELKTVRKSMDSLQNKLQMGLEIENHLKKKVFELEKKKILSDKMIQNGVSELLRYHSQQRVHIINLLDEGKSHLRSIIDAVEEKIRQLGMSRAQNMDSPQRYLKLDENKCQDVHTSTDVDPSLVVKRNNPGSPDNVADGASDASRAFAQALQDKVATLLLLSQQEERHLLERNVNAALQKKIEELQRNLLQVTNEKVKALMELAQVKQQNQLLQEKFRHKMKQENLLVDSGERRIITREGDGRLKSLLKKTYLNRWIGNVDSLGTDAESHLSNEGNFPNRRSSYSMDFARMKIENATLKESIESMEHLTSSIHRLRLSLLKAKESATSEGPITSTSEALDDIITEARLVKTALSSCLPVSWSGEADVESIGAIFGEDSSSEKIDSVSAAGFEMVELLIFAAQILKDKGIGDGS